MSTRSGPPRYVVSDPNLAACLMAVGIPLVPGKETDLLAGDAQFVGFNFLPFGEGGISLEDCLLAWSQEKNSRRREEDFSFQHPEHPMSYAMCTLANRRVLDNFLRTATPKVCIRRGSSVAVVDPNDKRVHTDEILARIGG